MHGSSNGRDGNRARIGAAAGNCVPQSGRAAAAGLAARYQASARYVTGPAAERLQRSVIGRFAVREICLPWLRQLASISAETVSLHVRIGRNEVRICSVPGTGEVMTLPSLGEMNELGESCAGQAILAFLPKTEISAYLKKVSSPVYGGSGSREARDEGGQCSKLRRTLNRIASRGFATTDGEHGTMAFPVRFNGQTSAAIAIEGPFSLSATSAADIRLPPGYRQHRSAGYRTAFVVRQSFRPSLTLSGIASGALQSGQRQGGKYENFNTYCAVDGRMHGSGAAPPSNFSTVPAFGQAAEPVSKTCREGPRAREIEIQKIEPFKMFDNLYHVGPCYVAAYLLTTPQGVIMFDTTQEPFVDKLIDNIKKVGVNPRDIKYIIINHGHIDHFGGAARMQELTGARVRRHCRRLDDDRSRGREGE